MEVTLGALGSIPEGEGRTFEVGRLRLAVFRSRSGEVFATQADCPHRGGQLADGLLGGGKLICPLHSLEFDLKSGRSANDQCSLKTYEVRLTHTGQIVVELEL